MEKYSFLDDYSEGCHPNILETLGRTNMEQQTAYGEDDYCQKAKEFIRAELGGRDLPIHFVSTGTLANLVIHAAVLRPHEAVIAANSGHIVVRETGAIEATGHKIIVVPSEDGKLTPAQLHQTLVTNGHFPHMARPRMVYISNSTEVGTVYSKAELKALSEVCRSNGLILMMDGARLGVALTATRNDLTLADVAELVDIFWIGGTKAGALLGEAIVIPNPEIAKDFEFHIKQRGGLLAKGRLMGIQFKKLFTDGLYYDLSRRSNLLAEKISTAIIDAGFILSAPTESNQVFPILPNKLIEKLKQDFEFYVWSIVDEESAIVRFVTSWATDDAQVDRLISAIKAG